MAGLSSVINAIDDPERYGRSYINNLASAFVPYSVGMGQIASALDPYQRDARGITDAIRQKIPTEAAGYGRESLLPRRDIWGNPIAQLPDFPVSGLTALTMSPVRNDPSTKALLDAGLYPAKPERKIRGVTLTPQQYDDYSRIAGRMAHIQVGNAVSNPYWSLSPTGVQKEYLQKIITKTREAAENAVMMQSIGTDNDIPKSARAARIAKLGG
jgi:hypothetical protein